MVVYCDFMAGCIGGAFGTMIGHPLDTIKTWQQAGNTRITRTMYNIVIRNNGLNGFYRGMMFPFMTSGFLNSILFGVYGIELRRLNSKCADDLERKRKWHQHVFIAGSQAGLIFSAMACPIELIKIRLQTQNYYADYRKTMTRGALVCIKRIYQKEGFFGFYRGWAPMLCRDVLPYGIYMLSYEYMIRVLDDVTWINAKRREHKCKSHKSFVCPNNNCFTEMCVTTAAGSVAGLLSWMFVIPFDVMKTIMQSQSDPNKYPKMRHVVKAKTNQHGWPVFFRGGWMLICRSIPVNTATFLAYKFALTKCQSFSNSAPICEY